MNDFIKKHLKNFVIDKVSSLKCYGNFKKNKELYKSLEGQRAFVMGNGVSLRNQDLKPLVNEITFCVNSFFLSEEFDEIKPKFYSIIDPQLLSFAFDETMQCDFADWVKCLSEKYPEGTMLLPYWAREKVEKHKVFQRNRIHYFNFDRYHIRFFVFNTWKVDLTSSLPGLPNSVLLPILVAIYSGVKKIYLMGCDHDWLSKSGKVEHVYAVNPFYNDKDAWNVGPYDLHLYSQLKLWKSYRIIDKIAQRHGVQIFNATDGGDLDVFPRVNYKDLIKREEE